MTAPWEIRIADTDAEIAACHPVMAELRPHIATPEDLVARVRRQEGEGYILAYRARGGRPAACAGYRYVEMLAHGRFLYVDDLVTLEAERSTGHGDALMDWLEAEARRAGCGSLQLDSGTQRTAAHRFYFRKRMVVPSFHFSRSLK
jgi:GNAT superfamily N-acetyltransferase